MTVVHDLAWFFGAALLTNAVPHLVSGVCGRAFQSPFAKPPGKGLSSAIVNVWWSWANLVAAWLLLARVGRFDWRAPQDALSAALGMLVIALFLARQFGPLHGGDRPGAA